MKQLDELKRLRDEVKNANILRKAAIAEQASLLFIDAIEELAKRVAQLERGNAPQHSEVQP